MDFIESEARVLYIREGELFKPVGCLTSNPLSEAVETISTTTKNSSGWRSVIPTIQSGEVSFDGFQILTDVLIGGDDDKLSYDSLKIKKRLRERIEWRVSDPEGRFIDSGFGYIQDIGESNQIGSFLTFSGLIIIDGEPSFTQPGLVGDTFQDGEAYTFQDGTPMTFN